MAEKNRSIRRSSGWRYHCDQAGENSVPVDGIVEAGSTLLDMKMRLPVSLCQEEFLKEIRSTVDVLT